MTWELGLGNNKTADLLNLTRFSEARDWHIWVIKYKDILLMNYASKMFSDHMKTVCVVTAKWCFYAHDSEHTAHWSV